MSVLDVSCLVDLCEGFVWSSVECCDNIAVTTLRSNHAANGTGRGGVWVWGVWCKLRGVSTALLWDWLFSWRWGNKSCPKRCGTADSSVSVIENANDLSLARSQCQYNSGTYRLVCFLVGLLSGLYYFNWACCQLVLRVRFYLQSWPE